MQKINLKGNHLYRVERGATSIVRLSNLTPELGPAILYCKDLSKSEEIQIIIEQIKITRFEYLNSLDIGNAGFRSLKHLREELETFYNRTIKPSDPVKLIHFFINKDLDYEQ